MADTIVCSRCGVANAAGDQFCGSCGAFLEWEGRETAERVPIAEPVEAPPPPPEPAPVVEDAASVPPEPLPQAGFTVCPHCGSGNPPGRTFCHKCGKLLISPKPEPSATAGRRDDQRPSRGLPGWLPFAIGAGIVVGVVAVVLAVLLRPAPLPTGATASATLTPTLAVPPSVTAPPPGSGVAPSAPVVASPAAPGESVQLTLSGASASSVAADTPDVAPGNVIDGRLDTRWEEALASAPGQWVEFTFAPSRLDYLVVYNGFQLSHDSFVATKRPQNIVVTVNGGAPVGFALADSETPQKIDVADTPGATVVRIQVASTYPASASAYPGSPIDAAAISEIRAFGSAGG